MRSLDASQRFAGPRIDPVEARRQLDMACRRTAPRALPHREASVALFTQHFPSQHNIAARRSAPSI
jgi:hypothetical protein